ncbi:MAG TPA: NAD(P)/FAD-dependent oxidoreductase [Candidatus Limnocylindrales bacterium]|nr:NAD(P)/FAD-dependent oxidoreductase [Candidatus Limnocylindrales bacterium]
MDPNDPGSARPRYCVIGAGAAGLAAMRALIAAGHDFDAFEATGRVGGHWHTDYDNLHLITPRAGSGFAGDPMPDGWAHFPRRSQMVEYLEGHADRFDLRSRVTFDTRVERLDPVGPNGGDGWDVTTSDGATRRYAGVLVANGHNSVPAVPTVPGTFTGRTLHSGRYHNPGDIAGSRVLVVGSGNSGCDIASELAQAGMDIVLSVRHGHLFQPKTFFGKPRGTLPIMKLPPRLLDPVLRLLIWMSVGSPEAYGLPKPVAKSLNDQRPVVNSLVLHWIQHGRVVPAPGLRRFDGDVVEFVDGSRATVDTVVWATGFRPVLPFLRDDLVRREAGIPLRVAGCILPYHGPARLYFVGLCAPRGPQLPVYSAQSDVIMDMLALQERMPRPLVELFSASDAPEARIDIVRAYWNTQMEATRRRLRSLQGAPRTTAPASGRSDPLPARAGR